MKTRLFPLLFPAEYLKLAEVERDLRDRMAELAAVRADLVRLQPPRARFDRYVALSDEDLALALSGTAVLPAMKAVMQVVDQKFQQASDAATDPELPDTQTKFNLGGADWIVRLKQDLQQLTERPRGGE